MDKKYYYLAMMPNDENAIPRLLFRIENLRVLLRLLDEIQVNPDFVIYVVNDKGERVA